MTELAEKEQKSEIKETEEEPKTRYIIPELCMYDNEDSTGYIIEVILPGVEKDTIKLKMNKDNLIIYGEADTLKYGGLFQLCCPVDPDKAKSTYKNGLLKIEVPYLDLLKDTVEIEIK
ncbi:MAG: Hsp20/alpha crystallin family protein [Candidatus Hermodarchaeota archaeon]